MKRFFLKIFVLLIFLGNRFVFAKPKPPKPCKDGGPPPCGQGGGGGPGVRDIPIDSYEWILIIAAVLLIVFYFYKNYRTQKI